MERQCAQVQQLQTYLKTRVMTILEPLQVDVLIHRPKNINQFCLTWLQSYSDNQNKVLELIDDQDQPDQIFKERIRQKLNRSKGFRIGVSGQSMTYQTMKAQKQQQKIDKSQSTKIKLLIKLKNSILFKNLSHQDIINMISVMKPKTYLKGQIVIKQGDVGNELFIVDQGIFLCHFANKTEVKRYESGQAFGQLSLLYGSKRASTIEAQTDGKVYCLDRFDFNKILRNSVVKKTNLCQSIINQMTIFSTMDKYQKSKLYENLKQIDVMPGKYIIRQGQLGDCFYIVAEGKLVAQKQEQNTIKPVFYYKQGDYFGEISLIRNVPRQASVKSLTKVKLIYIERGAFKRLLGPLQHILKRQEVKYKKFKEQAKYGNLQK